MNSTARIYGPEVFFNFIETSFDAPDNEHLIAKVKTRELDGFVTKGIFTPEEMAELKAALVNIPENEKMDVPTGKIFPAPFATISNAEDKLDEYVRKVKVLEQLKTFPIYEKVFTRLDEFFKRVGSDFTVKVPDIPTRNSHGAAGTFRFFEPGLGGLFVHCGYLFQTQSPFYYQTVEPMALTGQLSYFLVIQNPEEGGALTIYDMLWPDVTEKDTPTENDYVIKNGEKLYLKDVRSFSVKPLPGDVLIFAGGPIWHRVENVEGKKPRITLGGFLNFSEDGKTVFYWS